MEALFTKQVVLIALHVVLTINTAMLVATLIVFLLVCHGTTSKRHSCPLLCIGCHYSLYSVLHYAAQTAS